MSKIVTGKKRIIKIGIIDDHELFRKGLLKIIESAPGYTVSLEASDGDELISFLENTPVDLHPNVFLLDLKMPKVGGLECLKYIKSRYPAHRVLVLSMFDDERYMLKAKRLGADGYILKDSTPNELMSAIERVTFVQPNVKTMSAMTSRNGYRPKRRAAVKSLGKTVFTTKELEVLKLICQGYTNSEISKKVFKSVRTVEGYRHKLMIKSHTKNSPSLVAWAFRNELVD